MKPGCIRKRCRCRGKPSRFIFRQSTAIRVRVVNRKSVPLRLSFRRDNHLPFTAIATAFGNLKRARGVIGSMARELVVFVVVDLDALAATIPVSFVRAAENDHLAVFMRRSGMFCSNFVCIEPSLK